MENKIRPQLDDESIVKLIKKLYCLSVISIKELNAYDDKNCWIKTKKEHENRYIKSIDEHGYVLKITNALDSKYPSVIDGQNEMMLYLHQNSIMCPTPVKNVEGSCFSLTQIKDNDTKKYIVRLLNYCPGELLFNVPISNKLLHNVGAITAKINNILNGFNHNSFEKRLFMWMLIETPRIKEFLHVIKNDKDKEIIIQVIECFKNDIINNIDLFDKGIIHGDLNEQNLLVDNETKSHIVGIIDFGDSQYSCLIFDLIIAICYMIIQTSDVNAARCVIEGFESIKKLTDYEKKILKIGVCARMSQSLVYGAYSHLNDKKNNYILLTQKNGWKVLRQLWKMTDHQVYNIWNL